MVWLNYLRILSYTIYTCKTRQLIFSTQSKFYRMNNYTFYTVLNAEKKRNNCPTTIIRLQDVFLPRTLFIQVRIKIVKCHYYAIITFNNFKLYNPSKSEIFNRGISTFSWNNFGRFGMSDLFSVSSWYFLDVLKLFTSLDTRHKIRLDILKYLNYKHFLKAEKR